MNPTNLTPDQAREELALAAYEMSEAMQHDRAAYQLRKKAVERVARVHALMPGAAEIGEITRPLPKPKLPNHLRLS